LTGFCTSHNIKFHGHPSSWSYAARCERRDGWTDRHTDGHERNRRFWRLCEHVYKRWQLSLTQIFAHMFWNTAIYSVNTTTFWTELSLFHSEMSHSKFTSLLWSYKWPFYEEHRH